MPLATPRRKAKDNQVLSQSGPLRMLSVEYTFPASYVTGGEAVTIAGFDATTTVDAILLEPINGHVVSYNRSTGKIQAHTTAATELANASAALNGLISRGVAYVR